MQMDAKEKELFSRISKHRPQDMKMNLNPVILKNLLKFKIIQNDVFNLKNSKGHFLIIMENAFIH